ncbi:type I-C CRISPR-associated protein Cas5c [Kurthia sibirica]|uniref:pre-crRNA processing endonuclease n=1 Tax=Kurthia sibirica TaxID=202750 RepID=A0A2U3APG4_9BACL|nr:type I-C CRISPR-associated protein Cas5c [Kurthia sibirica]PWI26432.1 type I-C CRISPR-associated protein Cas5 [Kurthia sibirica]GEK32997.1 type I-C CRISPR-associated protein Cas5 [Kurthia sibirica]
MKKRNQIEFIVSGEYALFTDPLSRIGGEKMTYQIPTASALIGVVESIYWKPSIYWVIDEIKIINPIAMESKSIRPIKYKGGNTLAQYTYLLNPAYAIRAHFEFNFNRKDLSEDFNEEKHHNIAKRCVKKGGRRDIFLGTRECQAYVEPCEFDEIIGYYDTINLQFSPMLHSLYYPSQSGREQLEALFWSPKIEKGIIHFITSEQCTLRKEITDYEVSTFEIGKNMQSVDALFIELGVE